MCVRAGSGQQRALSAPAEELLPCCPPLRPQSLKEELASLGRENAELRAWKHRAGADLGAAKEALLR